MFHTTPEAVDRDFELFVDRKLANLHIEPRWDPAHVAGLRLSLSTRLPAYESEHAAWRDSWTTLA